MQIIRGDHIIHELSTDVPVAGAIAAAPATSTVSCRNNCRFIL